MLTVVAIIVSALIAKAHTCGGLVERRAGKVVSTWRLGVFRSSTLRRSWRYLRDIGSSHGRILLVCSRRTTRYLWDRHDCSIADSMSVVLSKSIDL